MTIYCLLHTSQVDCLPIPQDSRLTLFFFTISSVPFRNRPNVAAIEMQLLVERLRRRELTCERGAFDLYRECERVLNALTCCERIVETPVPFQYVQMSHFVTFFFVYRYGLGAFPNPADCLQPLRDYLLFTTYVTLTVYSYTLRKTDTFFYVSQRAVHFHHVVPVHFVFSILPPSHGVLRHQLHRRGH